jgi:hypothetical protein
MRGQPVACQQSGFYSPPFKTMTTPQAKAPDSSVSNHLMALCVL